MEGQPRYTYAHNKPTTEVDPSGLKPPRPDAAKTLASIDPTAIFTRLVFQGSPQLQRISVETLKVLGNIVFLRTLPVPLGGFQLAPDILFLFPTVRFVEPPPSPASLLATGKNGNNSFPNSPALPTGTSLLTTADEVNNLLNTVPVIQGSSRAIFIASHLDVVFDGRQKAKVADAQGSAKTAANVGDTSMHDMNDRAFAAYSDYFYVLPRRQHHNPLNLYENQFDTWDVQLGDVAAIIYRGRVLFAIAGELGPFYKLGEASAAVLGKLKHRPAESMPNRDIGGFDDKDDVVVTIIFPGTRHVGYNKDKVPMSMLPQTMVNAIGRQKLEELGAKLN